MRKIESQMCDAVQGNRNWKLKNTEVTIDKETNTSSVYLHGNLIATVTDNDMTIYDGGWQSVTTKSRLNALCDYFCISGEGVFQKDFTWYVRKFVGAINGQSKFITETFQSGYVFAWWLKLTKSGQKFTLSFTLWSCYSLYFRGDKFLPFFVSTATLNV